MAATRLVPPHPPIPPKRLPPPVALWMSLRNNLSTWPRAAYEEDFWRSRFFGADVLLVNEASGVRYVLNEAAANYRRPIITLRVLRPFGGGGVFLAEGGDWRRQRKMLSPLFTPARIGLLIPHFFAAADHLLRRLEGRAATNLARDFQDAALEAVLRALFSLPETEAREKLGALARFYFAGPGHPKLLDVFAREEGSFAWFARGRENFKKIWREAVEALIAERRAAQGGQGRDSRDLLDLLLAVRDAETGAPLDTAEIRDQCSTLLVAGFETTARLLFWLSYLLALDASEQEAIRAEIRAFPPERVKNLDDLSHWPLLRQAMLEALRLYPPAAHVVREVLEEDVVCGQKVGAGTQIWISPWIIHRHGKYWEQPEVFSPARFAGKTSPWNSGPPYMPFGAGPRICIGAGFAMAEAQILMAHLLARHRLSLESSRPVMPIGAVTVAPSHEPVFRLERV